MRFLFVGDVYGRSGRDVLAQYLPGIVEQGRVDVVVVNGENAAHGRGITSKMADEIFDLGAHCITMGDHAWDQRDIIPYVQKHKNMVRPLNMPPATPGQGICEIELIDGRKFIVIQVQGRVFMDQSDCPFAAVDAALKQYVLGRNCQGIFIDCHAEATSEKMAMAQYFGGRVSAVIGSHTHLPTADHHVTVDGTAFQADAGMTGCYDSVIGAKKRAAIGIFLKKVPREPLNPADGEGTLCGAVVDINDATGLALAIHPIRYGGLLSQAPVPPPLVAHN